MNMENETRKQYFEELAIRLQQEGFSLLVEQDGLLPVEWNGLPLCRITGSGTIRYRQEDMVNLDVETACARATDIAGTVKEYMRQMEQSPPLQAMGLQDSYKLLADFNGTVLAGMHSKYGVQFVTWDRDFNRKGVSHGHYCGSDYEGAKQDFAVRSGLISKHQLFSQEQLIEIYRCCTDALELGFELTHEQENRIKGVQEQIESEMPDIMNRIQEHDQQAQADETHSHEQTM